MIRLNLREFAQNIVGLNKLPLVAKMELAENLIILALEIINKNGRFPESEMEEIDEMYCRLELELGMLNPDQVVDNLVRKIKESRTKLGWDKRLLLKSRVKHMSEHFKHAIISMDLDETVKQLSKPAPIRKVVAISEEVNDNPNQELLNRVLEMQTNEKDLLPTGNKLLTTKANRINRRGR